MYELLGNFWFLVFASITITSVVGTLAHAWQKTRRAETATALRQAMLERGLSVDEMERLLRPAAFVNDEAPSESSASEPPHSDEQLVQNLTNRLAEQSASEETIQEVLKAFQAADPQHKRLLYHAIYGLTDGYDTSDEQISAVVRGLCGPNGKESEIRQNTGPKIAL